MTSYIDGEIDIQSELCPFLDKEYRDSYLDGHIRLSIATQIRALREKSGLSQAEFAKKMGMTQSVISRLEDTEYGAVAVNTLLRLARENNIALSIRFIDYPSLVREDITPQSMVIDDIFESYQKTILANTAVFGEKGTSSGMTAIGIFANVTGNCSTITGSHSVTGAQSWLNNLFLIQLPQHSSDLNINMGAFVTLNSEKSTPIAV